MLSYFKTQWFNLLAAALNFVVSIIYFYNGDELWGVAFMMLGVILVTVSGISYNSERINLLEKKLEEAIEFNNELMAVMDMRIKKLEDKLHD